MSVNLHRPVGMIALALSLVLIAACGSDADSTEVTSSANSDGDDADTAVYELPSGNLEAFDFSRQSVNEHAAGIFVGTVEGETEHTAPTTTFPDDRVALSLRDITVKVERVVAGTLNEGDLITLRGLSGWAYPPEGERKEIVDEGGTRLRPGDRAVFAVIRGSVDAEDSEAGYHLLASYSYILIENGETVRTARDHPFVRELEAMTPDEIVATLRDACTPSGCDRDSFPKLD